MIERFIDGGILNRGGTIKEMQESEEKYNRLTKVIEDYGVESFVEAACSFCNNVAANIFTEKYFLNIKMKKGKKNLDRICQDTRPTFKSIWYPYLWWYQGRTPLGFFELLTHLGVSYLSFKTYYVCFLFFDDVRFQVICEASVCFIKSVNFHILYIRSWPRTII